MTEGYDYREHLAEIKRLKRRYSKADTCAACGVIRELLPVGPLEPADNGVCCVGCLAEYPELWDMDRDGVRVWLWQHWRVSYGHGRPEQQAASVARAWLRVQARRGRVGASMADVAAAAYGLTRPSRDRLRKYAAGLGG